MRKYMKLKLRIAMELQVLGRWLFWVGLMLMILNLPEIVGRAWLLTLSMAFVLYTAGTIMAYYVDEKQHNDDVRQ